MGSKKERVTSVTKRGDCHKWIIMKKVLNVFMGVLEGLGAGRYINTSNDSGTRVLAR